MPPFSLFFPVFNEEAILVANTERVLAHLRGLGGSFEVFIGSNGSTDDTPRLGRELQARHPEVHYFELAEKGPGAAFRRAVSLMTHDVLVCLDIDLPVPLTFIADALKRLENYDLVIGSKKMGVETRSWYRRLGSDIFIAASHRLLGVPFDDYSLGAKAYRREVLERYSSLIDDGTFYILRIAVQAHRDGLRLLQIPVDCSDHRKSRFNLAREGFYRFGKLFHLWVTSPR